MQATLRATPDAFGTLALLALLGVQGSCASAPLRPMSEDQRNEIYRRIQVHEAHIEEAAAALRSVHTTTPSDEPCRHVRDLQFHAERVCHLADIANDPDARSRCAAATRTADAAIAEHTEQCSHGPMVREKQ